MADTSSKIAVYIQHRIEGADPQTAARLAGYAGGPSLAVAASRNETRADVRNAIRRAKRNAAPSVATRRRRPDDEDEQSETEKKLEPWKLRDHYANPLDLLRDVMNNPKAPGGLRIQCAKDALPYCHARKESSKKQEEKDNAKETGKSKFPTMPTPLRRAA